jgi:hypothetical protein
MTWTTDDEIACMMRVPIKHLRKRLIEFAKREKWDYVMIDGKKTCTLDQKRILSVGYRRLEEETK